MKTASHSKRTFARIRPSAKSAEKRFVLSVSAIKPTPEVLAQSARLAKRATQARNASFLDKYRSLEAA